MRRPIGVKECPKEMERVRKERVQEQAVAKAAVRAAKVVVEIGATVRARDVAAEAVGAVVAARDVAAMEVARDKATAAEVGWDKVRDEATAAISPSQSEEDRRCALPLPAAKVEQARPHLRHQLRARLGDQWCPRGLFGLRCRGTEWPHLHPSYTQNRDHVSIPVPEVDLETWSASSALRPPHSSSPSESPGERLEPCPDLRRATCLTTSPSLPPALPTSAVPDRVAEPAARPA
jgi:hypothetical protein